MSTSHNFDLAEQKYAPSLVHSGAYSPDGPAGGV